MLHTLNLLVILMSLTSNEDYITFLCHHTGCTNGFPTIDDTDDLLHLLGIETGEHVIDDVLRLFEARIVRGNDDTVTLLHGFLSHQWTFTLVTVTACATDGDDLSFPVEYFVNGIEHILQGIGSVGIVDDGGISLWRVSCQA